MVEPVDAELLDSVEPTLVEPLEATVVEPIEAAEVVETEMVEDVTATDPVLISSQLAPKLTLDDVEPDAAAVVDLNAVGATEAAAPEAPVGLSFDLPEAETPSLPEPPTFGEPAYVPPTFPDQPSYSPPPGDSPSSGYDPSTGSGSVPPYAQPFPPQAPYAQPTYPQAPYAQPNQPYAPNPAYGLQPQYPQSSLNPSEEQTWATAAHWSALVASFFGLGFLGPLLILLIQGQKSPRVRANAVESLNFEITYIIGMIASVVLLLVVVGFVTIIAFPLLWLIFRIVASVQTANGQDYRYPVNIRLVK